MAKRCKHDKDIDLVEFSKNATLHIVRAGQFVEHDSDYGNYTGRIKITCNTCGYIKILDRFSKNCPKWIFDWYEKILWDDVLLEVRELPDKVQDLYYNAQYGEALKALEAWKKLNS